jgi:hypothetical protein
MAFSKDDKQLIKCFRETKRFGARRFLTEFPEKGWSKSGLQHLLRKIDATGSIKRIPGSDRRCTVRTVENIARVEELVLSQEDKPQTHCTQRQIAQETGVKRSSVNRIVRRDLRLKCFKKEKAQELTKANKQLRKKKRRNLPRLTNKPGSCVLVSC